MDKDISLSIEKHIEWVKSMGKSGKRIYLDGKVITGENRRNFEKVLISSGEFVKCNMAYTQFFESQLEHSNFSKSDLSFGIFEDVKIEDCKFINSLLYGVSFKNVDLYNVNFTGAWIEEAAFYHKIVLKNIYGLEHAHVENIIVETKEDEKILKGKEVLNWLKNPDLSF